MAKVPQIKDGVVGMYFWGGHNGVLEVGPAPQDELPSVESGNEEIVLAAYTSMIVVGGEPAHIITFVAEGDMGYSSFLNEGCGCRVCDAVEWVEA